MLPAPPSILGVLAAAVMGVTAGMALSQQPDKNFYLAILEPIGLLWANALQMCVTPVVVSCLVVSIGSTNNTGALGVIGRRAGVIFLSLLIAATVFAVAIAYPILATLDVDPSVSEALRASAASAASDHDGSRPTLTQWITQLVPSNPVKAAADGEMLPLIVFSILVGLAARHISEESRDALLGFLQGVAESMFVLIRWILAVAPLSVFALLVPVVARLQHGAVVGLVTYIGTVIGATLLFGALVLYPLAALGGRMSVRRFVRGTLPAQVVAFGARSSVASLSVMIENSRTVLGLSEEVTVFLVPIAASIFRIGSAIAQTTAALFVARLYDYPLGGADLATLVLAVVVTSFSVPAIPSGTVISMAPVLVATGLPIAAIGLLLAVDAVPQLVRSVANVTGTMTAAVVLNRWTVKPIEQT